MTGREDLEPFRGRKEGRDSAADRRGSYAHLSAAVADVAAAAEQVPSNSPAEVCSHSSSSPQATSSACCSDDGAAAGGTSSSLPHRLRLWRYDGQTTTAVRGGRDPGESSEGTAACLRRRRGRHHQRQRQRQRQHHHPSYEDAMERTSNPLCGNRDVHRSE